MTNPLSKTLLEQTPKALEVFPCVITSLSPLLVTINGEPNIEGAQTGGSYVLGAANALWRSPAQPLIFPVSEGTGGGGSGVDVFARAVASAASDAAATALATAIAAQNTANLALANVAPSPVTQVLPAATGTGSFTAFQMFRFIFIAAASVTGTPRIRFYRSTADRTADAARPYTTAAPTDGSVIAEYRWAAGAQTFYTSVPIVNLLSTTLYYNVDGGTADITINYVREN